MVQFPEENSGVGVILRSDAQGVGKSRFAEYFGSLLGRQSVYIIAISYALSITSVVIDSAFPWFSGPPQTSY